MERAELSTVKCARGGGVWRKEGGKGTGTLIITPLHADRGVAVGVEGRGQAPIRLQGRRGARGASMGGEPG
jgi:hypothetical protein